MICCYAVLKGISGRKAQLNARQSPSHNSGAGGAGGERVLRPPTPQSLMIHHTIKENTLPIFKEWLKSATTKGVLHCWPQSCCIWGKFFRKNWVPSAPQLNTLHSCITRPSYPTERDVLLGMLQVAHDNSEEMRLSKVRRLLRNTH
jgi:hypothetical protein